MRLQKRTVQWARAKALIALVALLAVPIAIAQTETAPDAAPETAQPATTDAQPLPEDIETAIEAVDSGEVAPDVAAQAQQKVLEDIETSIGLSKERAAALKAEIDAMQGDRARQNAALIAAAERVKLAETDIVGLEEKLGDLIVQELEVRGRLDGADASISTVLASLQRISLNPPPALIVDPSDALGSARSAILISAILPELQQRADSVMADLNRLGEIKADALAQQEKLEANLQVLEEEQLRIGTLIAARKQTEVATGAALAAEEAEAQALADKAGSLRELIGELTRRATAVAAASQATATANAGGAAPALDADTIRIALANPDRKEPAVPFLQAKGYLTPPSSGVTVIDYGAGDGFGGISRGLSVVTRAEAQVVAPADGWVLFQGDYLNYGKIVILNAGQDYTILLAGLARVDVTIGQFVMMGEPVGSMGSRTIGRTVATSAGVSRPTLYIEMRQNNEPVDPTGWWATTTASTQSG